MSVCSFVDVCLCLLFCGFYSGLCAWFDFDVILTNWFCCELVVYA